MRVCERARLLVYVVDVQHFTHELDDRLGLVEGSGRHCKMKQGQEYLKTESIRSDMYCIGICLLVNVTVSNGTQASTEYRQVM